MDKYSLDIKPKDHVKGNRHSPVILTEFGDYECPFSRLGYRFVQKLLSKQEDSFCFVFRNFPLKKHPNAFISAEAALSAGKLGFFWEMHDVLFEHNNELSKDRILGFAEQLELDKRTFYQSMEAHEFKKRIQDEYRTGVAHGVNDTPTFFINGIKYDGKLEYKALSAFLTSFLT
ncbi:MAG: thioredoxin domain-containing protein [Bacteroidota bacterium]